MALISSFECECECECECELDANFIGFCFQDKQELYMAQAQVTSCQLQVIGPTVDVLAQSKSLASFSFK